MKVIVVGLGSMGKRRIRLINQIDKSIEIIGVDKSEERCREASEKFGISTANSIHAVEDAFCAFVCTSPLAHSGIIQDCLKKGLHVFTELNLISDMYEENIALAKKKDVVLFLSSTFNYRDEVQYISKTVKETESKVNYTYHIGQYLPDWHPWESYKNFFVGDKRSNGCREIMAIELPWLINLFGDIISYNVFAEKMTTLEVDYPDCFMIQLQHSSGTKGMLTVDVVSRKAVRNLEIFGEEIYLSWDGSPTGLFRYSIEKKANENIILYRDIDQQDGYSSFIVENAYKNEIETFFRQIETRGVPIYDFEKDKQVLALIDGIEKAGAL